MALPPEREHASHASTDGPSAGRSLVLIAAVAANGTIGANGALPWRLPDDLRRFRALTLGHSVIMGRRTWQSLGRPLSGRQNIVVTRDREFVAKGADVVHSLDAALARARLPGPVFCIGGAELYRLALPRAHRILLTEIAADFAGDTRWPGVDRSQWREVAREQRRHEAPDGFDYAYVTYERLGRVAAAAWGPAPIPR